MYLSQFANAELSLMIACVQRFLHSHIDLDATIECVEDWPLFLRICDSHKVSCVIHSVLLETNKITDLPSVVKQRLIQKRQLVSQRSLQLMAETLKLLEIFTTSGVRAIPLKGTVLATQLYGQKSLRQSADIDLLIEPNAYPIVQSLLRERGYQYFFPDATAWPSALEQLYLTHNGEITWVNQHQKIFIDIHLRLCMNKYALQIDFEQLWETTDTFMIQSSSHQRQSVRTLSMNHQILFLSVHAAKHYCSKLLWLTDLALILQQSTAFSIDWQHIYHQAHTLGVSRSVAQTLQLIDQVLDVSIPYPWHKFCQTQPVQSLVSASITRIRSLELNEKHQELTTLPLITRNFFQDLMYTMLLQNRILYKLSCMIRFLYSAKVWEILSLPRYFNLLNFPFRRSEL